MDRPIRWGILGLGKIAHKFAQDLKESKRGRLHAVASRSLNKAKLFSENYGVEYYYSQYQALVTNPEVQVVYIATPHALHLSCTILALKNGKAVLCEKPMGLNSNEVRQMIKLAQTKNLFLMEGLWSQFMPATRKVIELLHQKVLGPIQFLRADFGFNAPVEPQGRLYNKNLGGGSLLDVGLYPVYLSLLVLGVPDKIKAFANFTHTGVDAACTIMHHYPNGAKALLESSIVQNSPTEALMVGKKGYLKMHSRFHHATKVSLHTAKTHKVFEFPYTGNGYLFEIEEVNKCMLEGLGQSKFWSHGQSLKLMETLDRIKEKIGLSYT
jgi:predicted dehydrogenase